MTTKTCFLLPWLFLASGCLEEFIGAGGKYLFVSNVDNLGARVSPIILGLHVQSGKGMSIELAPKWPGDTGGSPFLVDDKMQLIEQIRYPDGFSPDIVDVFNTRSKRKSIAIRSEP